MRVCQKHFKGATETLKSLKTGEEFDLCPICEQELRGILYEPAAAEPESESQRSDRPRRPAGRPKTKVA